MTDADNRRSPGSLPQEPVERHFRGLVQCRGRLVEKDDFGAGEKHPGEREALLLANG